MKDIDHFVLQIDWSSKRTERLNCSNIIILTEREPEEGLEIASVRNLLRERYEATRQIQEFEFDFWDDTEQFLKVSGNGQPREGTSDTGIYVVVHGGEQSGMIPPISNFQNADVIASWLVSLSGQKFKIRKICFITCAGMAVDKQGNTKTARPIPDKDEIKIYVQNICYAISKLGKVEQLNGLMIAGYSSGVYLHKSVPENPDDPARRPGYKLTQEGKTAHVMHPDQAVGTNLTKKLQSYARFSCPRISICSMSSKPAETNES